MLVGPLKDAAEEDQVRLVQELVPEGSHGSGEAACGEFKAAPIADVWQLFEALQPEQIDPPRGPADSEPTAAYHAGY
jgi:hypothetical protein